jgi:hypothetical protein
MHPKLHHDKWRRGINASGPPPRSNRGAKKMRDTAKHRAKIIEHLETALTLCDQASEPIVGYLIERALDEARGSDWTGTPKPAPR